MSGKKKVRGRKPRPDRKTKTADVVRLRGEGKTYTHIAGVLGIPTATVFYYEREYWKEEHEFLATTSERVRLEQTDVLTRLQLSAMNTATNPNIQIVTEETDPLTGEVQLIKLDEFQKMIKAGNLVVKCASQLALLNGANKPIDIKLEAGTLPPEVFAAMALAHTKKK